MGDWLVALSAVSEELKSQADPDYRPLSRGDLAPRAYGEAADWKRFTFAPRGGEGAVSGGGSEPGPNPRSRLALAAGGAAGAGGGAGGAAGLGLGAGGAGGSASGSGPPILGSLGAPGSAAESRKDLNLETLWKDWMMRHAALGERGKGTAAVADHPSRDEKVRGYFLVEKIVPHAKDRHVRFLVISTAKVYVVEPFDPYKLKRGIRFADITTLTVDTHTATLLKLETRTGYTAYFLTVRRSVLEDLLRTLDECIQAAKARDTLLADPIVRIARVFDDQQQQQQQQLGGSAISSGGPSSALNPPSASPSQILGPSAPSSSTGGAAAGVHATVSSSSAGAGDGLDDRLNELTISDFLTKSRYLVPLLKLLNDSGYTPQDIFQGSVDLPKLMRMFGKDTRDAAAAIEGKTFVVEFNLPLGADFSGRASKQYNLNPNLPVERILKLICKKQGVKRWQRFALRTLKGTELHPDQTLGDYGLGILMLSWRLCLVYSETSEVRFTKLNTRIVESILAEVFSRFTAEAERREILRAELEEIQRLEREEEARLERERVQEAIRKAKREHELKMAAVAGIIDDLIEDVYYGSLANKKQRVIDMCTGIVMEDIVEKAWPPIARKLLIVDRVRALGNETQLQVIRFLEKLGDLSGRDLVRLVDSIGSGTTFVATGAGAGRSQQQQQQGSLLSFVPGGPPPLPPPTPGGRPAPPPLPAGAPSSSSSSSAAAAAAGPSVKELLEKKAVERQRNNKVIEDPEEIRKRDLETNKYSGVAKDLFLSLQKKFDYRGQEEDIEDLDDDSDFDSD
jgi:hypothetical protein